MLFNRIRKTLTIRKFLDYTERSSDSLPAKCRIRIYSVQQDPKKRLLPVKVRIRIRAFKKILIRIYFDQSDPVEFTHIDRICIDFRRASVSIFLPFFLGGDGIYYLICLRHLLKFSHDSDFFSLKSLILSSFVHNMF